MTPLIVYRCRLLERRLGSGQWVACNFSPRANPQSEVCPSDPARSSQWNCFLKRWFRNSRTISKNRHGRFQESKLFEELFEQIVRQCLEVGLVQEKHLSVDGSFAEANAAKESRIPREQLREAAQVHHTVGW